MKRQGSVCLAGSAETVDATYGDDRPPQPHAMRLVGLMAADGKAGYNASVRVRDLLPSERRRRAGVEDATRRALQGFVLPIWIGAGLADWWCHRRTDIEQTAGATESAIHVAMMIEGGLPTMLGLFCEVNAGVLTLTYGALAVHELTAVWDVAYAEGRREVTPTEQHVHGFLERVPLLATVMLTVLHWDQARSVFGIQDDPDWRIRPKRHRLSARYRAGVLGAVAAFVALPYGEELVRCLRASASAGRDSELSAREPEI